MSVGNVVNQLAILQIRRPSQFGPFHGTNQQCRRLVNRIECRVHTNHRIRLSAFLNCYFEFGDGFQKQYLIRCGRANNGGNLLGCRPLGTSPQGLAYHLVAIVFFVVVVHVDIKIGLGRRSFPRNGNIVERHIIQGVVRARIAVFGNVGPIHVQQLGKNVGVERGQNLNLINVQVGGRHVSHFGLGNITGHGGTKDVEFLARAQTRHRSVPAQLLTRVTETECQVRNESVEWKIVNIGIGRIRLGNELLVHGLVQTRSALGQLRHERRGVQIHEGSLLIVNGP
mmetsp:Transcript_14702/g.40644  ORF Transcript_14702/g.40644 Transcript_14702/m.40644 type:complete len:283 (-) Transcript_14702:864-1712(-)